MTMSGRKEAQKARRNQTFFNRKEAQEAQKRRNFYPQNRNASKIKFGKCF
jgi:hypothetical protein